MPIGMSYGVYLDAGKADVTWEPVIMGPNGGFVLMRPTQYTYHDGRRFQVNNPDGPKNHAQDKTLCQGAKIVTIR